MAPEASAFLNWDFMLPHSKRGLACICTLKPACRKVTKSGTCADRYLPAKAWKSLSVAERRATQKAKARGKTQFVPNAPAAKKAGKKARK